MAESQGKNRGVAWFENSVHPTLSKRIKMRPSPPPPTHEQSYPPQEMELEDVLGSIGLGHLASQYREHLDGQERRGGARGNHPLVVMSSDAYKRMLAHNKASHRARTTTRETEPQGKTPYAYDERGGSLGGESFKDSQGRKILVVRDFKPSDEPHEARNSIATFAYPEGDGLVPLGLIHSHPPSAFASQPSGSDINMARMNHSVAPLNLIMYPYGPETEAAGDGFTEIADNRNGQPVRGTKDALDASAYGRTAHTRALFSEPGPDGKPRVSTIDPRNIIVYDEKKGGYALTPDGFGQGIHGPALLPGEHFTASPLTTGTGHLETRGGRAGSDLPPNSPGIASTFGAGRGQIIPRLRGDQQQAPGKIASRRETAKSWFENSVHPALRKSEENQPQTSRQLNPPEYDKNRPGRIWAPANTASFFSPDPEINRRMKVSNALNLVHSCLEYQDPNDFLDHEDPSKRAYAKFLLHHVVRDTAAHPIDDSWLESVRDILGQEDHDYEKSALDSLPDKEGIEKHNQEMLDTYVEKPAHPAVKRALAAGYRPVQSDAFGDWGKKGALAYRFSPRTPGTGGGEDDDHEMSGKITFFPSTHEDFVNAGTEPPPGIGHDPTPTTDMEWYFKSMNAKKGAMMKSGRTSITAQVRKEEQRQGRKIHKEEKAEMRGVEHEMDHGIKAHEDKVMKLIAGVNKAYTKDQADTLASIDRYLRKAETDNLGSAPTPPAPLAQAPKPLPNGNGKFSAPPQPQQGFQLNNAVPANKPNNNLLPVVNYGGKEYGVGSVMSGIGKQIAQYTNANRAANPAPAAAPNPNVGVGAQGIGAMATTTANALTGGLWGQGAKLLGQQSTPTAQTGGGVTATRSPAPSPAPAAPAAKAFSKSQKEVLDRMDRWKKKTEEKLLEEEGKLADRIHSDHTGPGVPKFVGKYTHGVKQHEKRLKRVIDKLRDDEEAEVREEMDDQESKCSRCGKDPCVCGMTKGDLSKTQSVLSTPKPRVSARDVDSEGYLSDDVESRTASADQRRRAESSIARRSTIKPNNIREVNRRQIDRDISRPGSRANIAQGRQTKLAQQASGMKTKGDLDY